MTRLIDADALKYEPLPKGDRNYRTYNLDDAYDDGYDDAFTDIRNAPTIDAVPQWIPCSERLPKEREWIGTKEFGTTISDEVYVTFEGPTGERFCKHLSFQNGKLSPHTQREIDVWYKGSIPIAWMPLPEPYEGKE